MMFLHDLQVFGDDPVSGRGAGWDISLSGMLNENARFFETKSTGQPAFDLQACVFSYACALVQLSTSLIHGKRK